MIVINLIIIHGNLPVLLYLLEWYK